MTAFNLTRGQDFEVRFCNYRDEWETRHLVFQGVDFGANEYYRDQQWFLRCWDVERGEPRSFPIRNIDPHSLRVITTRATLVIGTK